MRTPCKEPTFLFRVMHRALLGALGDIDYDRRHVKDVRGHRAESIELSVTAGHPRLRGHAHIYLGLVSLAEDDADGARRHFVAALTISGMTRPDPAALEGLAFLAVRTRSFARALTLHGAASSMPWASGLPPIGRTAPVWPWVGVGTEFAEAEGVSWIGTARRYLGRAVADRYWRDGASMSKAQAVAYALSDAGEPSRRRGPLSGREKQIAALVARGHRNREIAERLTISTRTVDAHVEHIRNKLGHQSRAQVASWATAQGLVSDPTPGGQ